MRLNSFKNWQLFLIFTGLAFLVFGNSISGQFVYDDVWVISRNPTIPHFGSVFSQFVLPYHYLQPETGLYRPLTVISFTVNFLFGKSPVGFHIVNILLHALNSWLLFYLIDKVFENRRLALTASLLFLVLPIHVEAVASISGRADELATAFSLLALYYGYGRKYWLSSIMFLLALLAKESAVALAPLLALMVWWREDNFKNSFYRLLFFVPSGLVYVWLRYLALKENFLSNDADFVYNPLKYTDPISRLATALKVMLIYLAKTFYPAHLSADYSFNQIPIDHSLISPGPILGLLVLALFFVLAIWPKTKTTPFGLGAWFFIFTFFVISNFIFPIGTILGERVFYLPSLGIVLMTAWAVIAAAKEKYSKVLILVLAILLFTYGGTVLARNLVWHDQGVLFQDMVDKSPASAHAKTNLGIYYLQQADAKSDEQLWQKGKALLDASLVVAPEHLPTLDSLGIYYEHEKNYPEAEKYYLKALAIKYDYATAISNIGRLYFSLGQFQKLIDVYVKVIDNHPGPGIVVPYAMSQSKLGHYDAAIEVIVKNYGQFPEDPNLQFALGYAYYKKGDKAKAEVYFKKSKNPNISQEEFLKSIEKF